MGWLNRYKRSNFSICWVCQFEHIFPPKFFGVYFWREVSNFSIPSSRISPICPWITSYRYRRWIWHPTFWLVKIASLVITVIICVPNSRLLIIYQIISGIVTRPWTGSWPWGLGSCTGNRGWAVKVFNILAWTVTILDGFWILTWRLLCCWFVV